jgi:hypothetical protein
MKSMRTSTLNHSKETGGILAVFCVTLVVFFGVLAILIDLAWINYSSRYCQNVADATALAGGKRLMEGESAESAKYTSLDYLTLWNSTDSTIADIHTPPISGPYQGVEGYIEIFARKRVKTMFLRFAQFGKPYVYVYARAVAGAEAFLPEDGVITLDPNARPGLSVGGSSALKVNGRIVVNSEGGGTDEFGVPMANEGSGVAISGGNPNSDKGVFARIVDSVGGVDNYLVFKPLIPNEPPPLKTGSLPEPDPYLNVVTPYLGNGLDPTYRGSVNITNQNATGLATDDAKQNRRATQTESVAGGLHTVQSGDVILHPGIYDSISITGGTVYFIPGIYVLRAKKANQATLKVTGGNIKAEGLMFYNTGNDFRRYSGNPDKLDLSTPPPGTATTLFGSTEFNASFSTTPINTSRYNYATLYSGAQSISKDFDGMMFYQRRHNTQVLKITGNTSQTSLSGTFYGKWMPLDISGQGKYDAQFVVGNMKVTGNGTVEVTAGNNAPKAKGNSVFLVE